ncbi:MAG: hypothetical protein AB8G18_01370 [Gammaproteobacteria bacterium]
MSHFAGVIALIILITAPIWFFVGWYLSGISRTKQQHLRETEWNHNLNTLRRDRDSFRDQVEVAHGKIRVLENRRADGKSPPGPSENEVASKALIARMQNQLDQAKQQINGFSKKVQELQEQSVEREDALERLKKKLKDTSRTLHDRDQKLALVSSRTQPLQQKNLEDTAQYEQRIQKLRVETQTQGDAAEQDRQRLEHTISEHMQTIGALRKEISLRDSRIANEDSAQQKLDALRAEFDQLRNENHEQIEKIEQLSQGSKVVEHQRSRLKALQTEYDEQQQKIVELERVIAHNEPSTQAVQTLQEQLGQHQSAHHKLTRSHASLEEQLDAAREELAKLRQEASDDNAGSDQTETLRETLRQQERTIADLQQKTIDQKTEFEEEVRQIREIMQTQEHIVAQLRTVLSDPAAATKPDASRSETRVNRPQSGDLFAAEEPAKVPHTPTVTLYEQAPEHRDDLKKINGIGPAFERALNTLGLYTFEQIAAFTDGDIEWVAQELRSFPDRIINGHWMEQAENLLTERDL